MNTFILLKILATLVVPPASLAVGVVLWLAIRVMGWRRLAATVLGLSIFQTLALSFPPVSGMLVGLLESKARSLTAGSPSCCYEAIVVLGGGIAPASPPHTTEPELTEGSDRIWQAARLYRAGAAPKIIVSGGSFIERQGGPATTEAEAMRRFLIDLGVPNEAIVSEGKALNTIENIANVRDIVKGGRVAIITSAYHVPRAAKLASKGGLDFAMFGVDWSPPDAATPLWDRWLPSVMALNFSNRALRELIALSFDRRGEGLAQ